MDPTEGSAKRADRVFFRRTILALVEELKAHKATDLEIAHHLAGLKLGFITGTAVNTEDAFSCAEIAFELQKKYDPGKITWEG